MNQKSTAVPDGEARSLKTEVEVGGSDPKGISSREDTAPSAAAISAKAWVDCRATLVEARVRVGALPKTRETALALTKIDEAVLWLDASLLNRDDREVRRDY